MQEAASYENERDTGYCITLWDNKNTYSGIYHFRFKNNLVNFYCKFLKDATIHGLIVNEVYL